MIELNLLHWENYNSWSLCIMHHVADYTPSETGMLRMEKKELDPAGQVKQGSLYNCRSVTETSSFQSTTGQ